MRDAPFWIWALFVTLAVVVALAVGLGTLEQATRTDVALSALYARVDSLEVLAKEAE